MLSILSIFCSIGFGILCSKIARKKNRNTSYWLYLGFFFGIIALIVIYFLKPCIDKKNFTKYQTFDFFISLKNDKNYWYYLDENKKQIGPMSAKALFETYLQKKITNNTFVWNDTMNNWIKLKDASIFANVLKQITN